MNKPEFLTGFESMLRLQGKNIASPGAKDMGDEYFARFKELGADQWLDLCEAAKDTIDRFPTRKQLNEIAAHKGYFESAREKDPNRHTAMTPVECSCGRSFILRDVDLQGIITYDCPGKTYGACLRSYEAGYLRSCKRASNGVIWINQQPLEETIYPSFLKD